MEGRTVIGLLGNVAIVVLFAWLARGLLAAREVTWPRLFVATLLGLGLGATVAGLVLIDLTEFAETGEFDVVPGELYALALPFQIVGTMVVVVVFELVLSRPPRRRELRPVRPLRALRRRLGIATRAVAVMRIVTRHGLAPLLGLRRGEVSARSPEELARRARSALEEAGGMFVKLGQLLATRPDLLPPEALEELGRLHAAAAPLGRGVVEAALAEELGRPLADVFASVTWEPLGSASIAQAHVARLHDGREVVLKLRRPGLEDVVERDLAIASWFARLAQRRTAWGRTYEASALADEFASALREELDFRLEGRAAAEVAEALADVPSIRAPEIVEAYTTPRLLVMERLAGVPLSSLPATERPSDARRLADELCQSQVQAMLQGERFHGDPHPGNLMVLPDGGLGLIDFGITAKLDSYERSAMFQLLIAIELEQPALLYESLVGIGAVDPARNPDEIERRLARFLAANVGPGLPPADALVGLLRLTLDLGIRLPPQASTMFRALATLAGTLERLSPDYPIIDEVARLGGAQLRGQTSPTSMTEFIQREWAQVGPMLQRAPRHLDRIATMVEHGGLTTRLRLFTDAADVRVVERLLNRAVLTVLALGVGVVSVMLLGTQTGPELAGTEVRLVEVLGWTGLFAATVLVLRVLLDILRTDVRDP